MPERPVDLGHRATHRALDSLGHAIEDVLDDVLVLVQERPSCVGDFVDLLAFHIVRDDESFVLEPLQRRVDGARRRRIAAVHPLLQILHDFVSMTWLIAQQLQNDVLHVAGAEPLASPSPWTATAKAPTPRTKPKTE